MTMSIKITSSNHQTYTVATPVYEGPLDLLLQLIEKAELDITKLALAQVTDQYLERLKSIEEHSPEEVSSFLVIAARLIQIKSEVLLPRPPHRQEGEEDLGEELARQLREYKRFKQISEYLYERELQGLHSYIRLAPIPHIDSRVDVTDIDIMDLFEAARYAYINAPRLDNNISAESVVIAPRITIRKKISMIASRLKLSQSATFKSMLGKTRSRVEIVVTFLAILELIKRNWIRASQNQLFGDIELHLESNWEDNGDIELEFGE
jgi:segregation and condensation protein A